MIKRRLQHKANLFALQDALSNRTSVDLSKGDDVVKRVLATEDFGGEDTLIYAMYNESARGLLDSIFGEDAFNKLFAPKGEGLLDKQLERQALQYHFNPHHFQMKNDLDVLKERILMEIANIDSLNKESEGAW